MGTDEVGKDAPTRDVVADVATYRRALADVIAAAYRALDTWEVGDLAGSVTALGAAARHWDRALGLGVARPGDDASEDGEDTGTKEGAEDE